MQFSLEPGNIWEQLIFFAVVVSVVKADEPPGIDALELIADGFSISLQQLVSVNCSSLAFGFCPHPQRLQQCHLLANYLRLICHQAAVKHALLVITPNLGTDGVGFSNPHTHLESAVVVAERWQLEQDAGLLLTPGLRLQY